MGNIYHSLSVGLRSSETTWAEGGGSTASHEQHHAYYYIIIYILTSIYRPTTVHGNTQNQSIHPSNPHGRGWRVSTDHLEWVVVVGWFGKTCVRHLASRSAKSKLRKRQNTARWVTFQPQRPPPPRLVVI